MAIIIRNKINQRERKEKKDTGISAYQHCQQQQPQSNLVYAPKNESIHQFW